MKVTIGGVDVTDALVQAQGGAAWRLELGERGTANFITSPGSGLVPDRFEEVVAYAKDDVTPIWGGLVERRQIEGITAPQADAFVNVPCVDFFAYLDWTFPAFTLTGPVTTKDILIALVAELPGSYGITLDGAQDDGVTYDGYVADASLTAMEIVRNLSTDANLPASMSPTKVLRLVVPGAVAAPFAITDGNPHCRSCSVDDSDEPPANRILVVCGPTGEGTPTQTWTADGVTTSFEVDVPAVVGGTTGGVVREVGVADRTVSGPGGGGYYEWDETVGRGTISVGTGATPGVGVVLEFVYTALYPFTVEATAGLTPEITARYVEPGIVLRPDGQLRADSLLTQRNQSPRQAVIVSIEDGWAPGQALTIDLPARGLDVEMIIRTVEVRLLLDDLWEYTILAEENTQVATAVLQASELTVLREVLGGGAVVSGGAVISGGGTVTVLASPFPLGGSDQASQPAGANAWADVLNANDFYPTVDQTVTVRAWLWSRVNLTDVQAALYCVDDNVNVATSSTIAAGTTRPANPLVFVAVVEAGKRYRLRQRSHTAGVSPYAIGQLAA